MAKDQKWRATCIFQMMPDFHPRNISIGYPLKMLSQYYGLDKENAISFWQGWHAVKHIVASDW